MNPPRLNEEWYIGSDKNRIHVKKLELHVWKWWMLGCLAGSDYVTKTHIFKSLVQTQLICHNVHSLFREVRQDHMHCSSG